MITRLKLEILFPQDGTTWSDVSEFVRPGVSIKKTLHGSEWQSSIDTCEVQLNFDETTASKFALASGRILARLDDADTSTPIFTGYIRPDFSQHIRNENFSEGQSCTIYDNSFLLDEKIKESITWPAAIGGTQYKICDHADQANSILHKIATLAGYISGVDAGVLTAADTVLQITAKQGEETYRSLLDGILSEHGLVLRTTAAGKLTLSEIKVSSVLGALDLTGAFGHGQGVSANRTGIDEDGIEIVWSQTATLQNALLYQASLPFNVSPPNAGFTGEPIASNDYYPPDSDVEEIYQDYDTQWLDVPYITRQVRQTDAMRNKDISLLNTSGHALELETEAGIATDLATYEATRARIRLKNTAGAIKKVFIFRIRGTALYRQTIKKTLSPAMAQNPLRIETRYIFDSVKAENLARLKEIELKVADFEYSFALRREDWPALSLGDIVKVYVAGQGVDSFARVTEIREKLDEPMVQIRSKAVTTYSAGAHATTGTTSTGGYASQGELASRPTFEDIINGFDGSGGTTTPDTPTVTITGFLSNLFITWTQQPGLVGNIEHELQRAPDSGGAPGSWATVYLGPGYSYVDQNLTLGGTSDSPTNAVYWYRSRRIVNGVSGSWATSASGTARPAGAGLIEAGAINANKMAVGLINALVAQINSYLIISSTVGWVAGKDDGVSAATGDLRAYLDQDEIRLQEYRTSSWVDMLKLAARGTSGSRKVDQYLSGILYVQPEDNASEGGQIWMMRSSNSYQDWYLDVYQNTFRLIKTAPGTAAVGSPANGSASVVMTIDSSVNRLTISSINLTSSRTKKHKIKPFTRSALDVLKTVEVVEYFYKPDLDLEQHKHVGFIAEDTDEILSTRDHNTMSVQDTLGLLIKAVQELEAKNAELEARINAYGK
jgi:hypothetical protein